MMPDTQTMTNIRNLYQIISQSRNPYQVFEFLARQNPQLQPVLQMMQGGMTPESIFNQLCKQRGINPQEFLNSITNNPSNHNSR